MKIIQLKNYTMTQMMGFFIVTDEGHVIAIDGGNKADTEGWLRRVEAITGSRTGKLDAWFMTHPHDDHYGVFITVSAMARTGQPVPQVTQFCWCPQPDSIGENQRIFANQIVELNTELAVTPFPLHPVSVGETYTFGSLTVEVLRIADPAITEDCFNNSSVVLRLTEKRPGKPDFVFIVLGDLGVRGGFQLLDMYPDGLRADAVQMAHHGQNGCTREVYEAIHPRFAFWTTPDWLWTNTIPGGEPGKGPFATLLTRSWMEALGTEAVRPTDEDVVFDTALV